MNQWELNGLHCMWMLKNLTYLESSGVQHIANEIGKSIENKNIKTKISRI